MAKVAKKEQKQPQQEAVYVDMPKKQIIQVLALGVLVGLVAWGLYYVLETYVMKAIMCQGGQTVGCNTGSYAEMTAVILASGIGLFGLVRVQTFRPLLVALAAMVGLWGVFGAMSLPPWYIVGLYVVLLYAISYLFFAWLARIRSFVAVIIVAVAVVAIVRYILYF